ncbi:SGNH/GDSL hydrolase family protein [Ekhidna sp.]|uniref:SGNH/GDSL hydrolase family protein n=1 Tax=Ekhidna sp. TaxID=2608089 RepID=UPI003B5000F0
MKITVIGNSVALRVRPPQDHPDNENYSYRLKHYFGQKMEVENKALGATTIANWLKKNDEVFNSLADIYIINIGVVDSTIREVPLWYYRLATRKVDNLLTSVCKALYRGPLSKARRYLSILRGRKSWISIRKFEKMYDSFLMMLIKETNARIITLPINIANDRIENQLPGSQKNHYRYNELIKEITAKHNQIFLDLSDLTSEEHYPDGVHFNKDGHKVVADRLIALINEK